ncbi:hypothetical protein SUVZ_03G0460 [Saccharomyces uvarum]|uniref:Uncharacterized protein n=1 Tax=Saccharomyces uvarum TaxID=230603 RepID=A0ABN8WW66_SACUV|nr:hypothetical protein SUVZ_03G0460 [Saccharomyces uvarum]
MYRDCYTPSTVWDNITVCLSNVTDAKMVIDKSEPYGPSPINIWLDTGSADCDDINEGTAAALVKCVEDNTANRNVHVMCHNSYATIGSYDSNSTYDEFYDYFGHGYPINYPKDYESDENADHLQSNLENNWWHAAMIKRYTPSIKI